MLRSDANGKISTRHLAYQKRKFHTPRSLEKGENVSSHTLFKICHCKVLECYAEA